MQHIFRFHGTYKHNKQTDLYEWSLIDQELHHLTKVLRLEIGQQAEVFDGKGALSSGTITSITRHQAMITSSSCHKEAPTPNPLCLMLGAIKPTSMDQLLPFICECGLDEIHIFPQEKTASFRLNDKAIARWQKILLQSTKQAKRIFIPKIHTWSSCDEMSSWMEKHSTNRFLLSNKASVSVYDSMVNKGRTCIVIGSEQGLSQEEEQQFIAKGCQPVSCGPYILRSMTASIGASFLFHLKKMELTS